MFGKNKVLEDLREKADALREWMLRHTSPDTTADEFCQVANDYAIIVTRIYTIEKQW